MPDDEPLVDLRQLFSGLDLDSQLYVFSCMHNSTWHGDAACDAVYSRENIAFLKEFYPREHHRSGTFIQKEAHDAWLLIKVLDDIACEGDDYETTRMRGYRRCGCYWDSPALSVSCLPAGFQLGAALSTLTHRQAIYAYGTLLSWDRASTEYEGNSLAVIDLGAPEHIEAARRYVLDPITDPDLRVSVDLLVRQSELLYAIDQFDRQVLVDYDATQLLWGVFEDVRRKLLGESSE